MSERVYRVLEKVLEERSFTNAANALNLTPSAVSHMVAKLEDRCGFPLLFRNKTGIGLTKEGERLVPVLLEALRAEEKVEAEIQSINRQRGNGLHIGTLESIFSNWLPEVVVAFKNKYPDVEINITEGIHEDVKRWVKEGTVDVSFVSMNKQDTIEAMPLYKEELLCVVSCAFHPVNSDSISVDEIKDCNIIMQRKGDDFDYKNVFGKRGYDVLSKVRVSSTQAILSMVGSGLGVGILPKTMCSSHYLKEGSSHSVKCFSFHPKEYRTIGIALSNEPTPTDIAKAFRRQVKEFLKYREGSVQK